MSLNQLCFWSFLFKVSSTPFGLGLRLRLLTTSGWSARGAVAVAVALIVQSVWLVRLYVSVAASWWFDRAAPAPDVRASGCFFLALGGGAFRQPLRVSSLPQTVVAGDCFGSDSIAARRQHADRGAAYSFLGPVSRQLGRVRVPRAGYTRDRSVDAYDGRLLGGAQRRV